MTSDEPNQRRVPIHYIYPRKPDELGESLLLGIYDFLELKRRVANPPCVRGKFMDNFNPIQVHRE